MVGVLVIRRLICWLSGHRFEVTPPTDLVAIFHLWVRCSRCRRWYGRSQTGRWLVEVRRG